MLPRRQPTASRALRSPHAAPVGARRAILSALALIFLLGLYVNFQFLSSSPSSSHGGRRPGAASVKTKQLTGQLGFETREVRHVAFTSGCRETDLVHAEVLAHSLRRVGFRHNISHLVYGCSVPEFEELQRKKNPRNSVEHVGFPAIPQEAALFGEDLVTTTLQFKVVQQWFKQELNRNRLKDDDFVMLVDSDAIFTKKIDIWNLFREVEDIQDPRWFGQDAAWYWPKRLPLDVDEMQKLLPSNSRALKIKDWRDYAATGPYVVEVSMLREVLPTIVEFWEKLPMKKRHLALPLAAAHLSIPIGISGVLSVHHYPSRYENWDFVDDIKYNPCNETARPADIDLLSFPISIRAQNFTLPPWIDGRDWSFFDEKIPKDFLHCDAWLLREPKGHIWHLASTTKGYERVPTILRRRHTTSVCMALKAYNAAVVGYKQAFCPTGFNQNKRIPFDAKGKTWPSALAYGANAALADGEAQFGDVEIKKKTADRPLAGHRDSEDVHFVFVTGCSADEHWQSDLLAQSFEDVQQRGRLTRVVAGCSETELKQLLAHSSQAYPHLQLFATKSYAMKPTEAVTKDDVYAPYNKPFGLRDWLRGANPPVFESIVVLLNGDFVFTRPMTFNSAHRVATAKQVDSKNKQHTEVVEGLRVYKPFFVYQGQRPLEEVSDEVEPGVGLAQRWAGSVGLESMIRTICPDCPAITAQDAQEYYSVGPPLALTRQDLTTLVDDYGAMTVKTRLMDPTSSIAEMVGFVVAAVKHKVEFTPFDNIAVTGDGPGGDAGADFWGFLKFVKKNPCDDKDDEPAIVAEGPRLLSGEAGYKAKDARTGSQWVFDKNLVPSNVFSCDSWLLRVPPKSLWVDAKKSEDAAAMKQVYGVCTSIKTLNCAIVAQRQRLCPNGFNRNKALRLVDPRPAGAALKVGAVDRRWDDATHQVSR